MLSIPMPDGFKIVELSEDWIYLDNGDVIGRCDQCRLLSSTIRFVWDSRKPDESKALCGSCRKWSPPLPEPRPTCEGCGHALHWERRFCLNCNKEV